MNYAEHTCHAVIFGKFLTLPVYEKNHFISKLNNAQI